jgi:SAM-dependent methyltransferase
LFEIAGKRVPAHGLKARVLDVGCFEGALLDQLATRTDWMLSGVEPNPKAAAVARAKGHTVWQAGAEDVMAVVPGGSRFDLIFLSQVIEHVQDPLGVVRRLKELLRPEGMLVLSTPNLDAKQIELFGPTWAHWHLPYHRALFSRQAMRKLAEQAGMRLARLRTYSHPYWTCLSFYLNRLGLGGAVPHTAEIPPDVARAAASFTAWSKVLWDWRGKGDYLVAALTPR